jgi:hypothetical protein
MKIKKAKEVIWWVLEAIKRELELQEYGLLTVISFDLEDLTSKDPNSPSIEDTRKAVYLLEKKYKALKIVEIDNPRERRAYEKSGLDYRSTRSNATWFVFEIPDRSKFDELVKTYISSEVKTSIDNNPISTPTKRDLRKKINNIKKNGKFGKKEKAFLKCLAKDFEPKTIEKISQEVSSTACKALKCRVQKKLKNTEFFIETIRADTWGRKSQYQLKFLTPSANS